MSEPPNIVLVHGAWADGSSWSGVVERLLDFDEIVSWYGENRADFRELVTGMGLPFRFLRALPDGSCRASDRSRKMAPR